MQQGGSPYGAPPHPDSRNLFPTPPPSAQHQMAGGAGAAESAVPQPISTRPPPPPSSSAAPSYEEFGAAAEDPLGDEGGAGGGGMSGGSGGGGGGNRWPRQETLALLKIRSDMDATFRDATLKGPLWEEVSRKLAELGYRRSAKKCKEKFENVHKYYKRTKEGRAGRQDGKSYRFFSQLEALHSTTAAAASSAAASGPSVFTPAATTTAAMGTPISAVTNQPPAVAARFQAPPPQQQQQISAPTPIATAPPTQHLHPMSMLGHEHQNAGAAAAAAGMSFTSNTSSDASDSEGDEDDEATEEGPSSGKKRKREGGAGGRKMMAFFEGLMRQVMERQEAMQQRFLDAIEKREQDRMIRDEAWRRQEIARLAREQELAAGERAAAAARDAAVISFLQKFTGQTVPIPPHAAATTAPSPAPAPAPAPSPATISIVQTPPPLQIQTQQLTSPPSQPQQQQQPPTPPPQQQSTEIARQQYHQQQQQTPPPMRPTSSEIVPFSSDPHEGGASMSVSLDPASSRWPKLEVHALIKLRSGLDSRYQESGPKGPLWEEISAGMQRLGYKRSAKRCKEKWENINKYFKKVKESNKKRPEDAKTCPYFHQLDALYRNKLVSGGVSGGMPASSSRPHEHESHLNPSPNPISVMPPPVQQQQQQPPPPPTTNQGEMDIKKGNGDHGSGGPNNGGLPTAFYGDDSTSGMQKKPEDIVKELMGQSSNDYSRLDEPDSDNMDEDDDEEEDDEDDEDGEGQYTIQFQRQNVGGGGANANANGSSGGGGASTAPPSSGGKAAGSFLAMVR